ncbi:alpha-hydroxy acid oxidase [Ruegeria sp.]|uniref:alpha-hydroxy acid oxidase n=1 Tax=Ruegeria sp. TaxID=1879320 RepID=UPI003C7AD6BF
MTEELHRHFPRIIDLERRARQRLPGFARDFIFEGVDDNATMARNRAELSEVTLTPRSLHDAEGPDLACTLFGQQYAAPFGVSPVGGGEIAWPQAGSYLASAAARAGVAFTASTYTAATLEELRQIAGPMAWLQLYVSSRDEITVDLLNRAEAAGYEVLLVTMDVPAPARRAHDLRNALEFPFRFNLIKLWQMAINPVWSWANLRHVLRHGMMDFANLRPYMDRDGRNAADVIASLSAPVTADRLSAIRDRWPGKLVAKGVLSPTEAAKLRDLGCDGVVVSNHGGRQYDAAPSPVEVLPAMRSLLGPDYPILAEGGVRSGLDICRLIALGADFVCTGRPFYAGVAALGPRGADHVLDVFLTEFATALRQIGCQTPRDLPEFLF